MLQMSKARSRLPHLMKNLAINLQNCEELSLTQRICVFDLLHGIIDIEHIHTDEECQQYCSKNDIPEWALAVMPWLKDCISPPTDGQPPLPLLSLPGSSSGQNPASADVQDNVRSLNGAPQDGNTVTSNPHLNRIFIQGLQGHQAQDSRASDRVFTTPQPPRQIPCTPASSRPTRTLQSPPSPKPFSLSPCASPLTHPPSRPFCRPPPLPPSVAAVLPFGPQGCSRPLVPPLLVLDNYTRRRAFVANLGPDALLKGRVTRVDTRGLHVLVLKVYSSQHPQQHRAVTPAPHGMAPFAASAPPLPSLSSLSGGQAEWAPTQGAAALHVADLGIIALCPFAELPLTWLEHLHRVEPALLSALAPARVASPLTQTHTHGHAHGHAPARATPPVLPNSHSCAAALAPFVGVGDMLVVAVTPLAGAPEAAARKPAPTPALATNAAVTDETVLPPSHADFASHTCANSGLIVSLQAVHPASTSVRQVGIVSRARTPEECLRLLSAAEESRNREGNASQNNSFAVSTDAYKDPGTPLLAPAVAMALRQLPPPMALTRPAQMSFPRGTVGIPGASPVYRPMHEIPREREDTIEQPMAMSMRSGGNWQSERGNSGMVPLLPGLLRQPLFRNPRHVEIAAAAYAIAPYGSFLCDPPVLGKHEDYRALRDVQVTEWRQESISKGDRLFARGQWTQAARCYAHALDVDHCHIPARHMLAQCHYLAGKVDEGRAESLRIIRECRATHPPLSWARYVAQTQAGQVADECGQCSGTVQSLRAHDKEGLAIVVKEVQAIAEAARREEEQQELLRLQEERQRLIEAEAEAAAAAALKMAIDGFERQSSNTNDANASTSIGGAGSGEPLEGNAETGIDSGRDLSRKEKKEKKEDRKRRERDKEDKRSRSRDRKRERSDRSERSRDKDKDKDRDRDAERDRERRKARDRDRDRDRDWEREKDRYRDSTRERTRTRTSDRDYSVDGDWDRERGDRSERSYTRSRDREQDRHRYSEDRDRDRSGDRATEGDTARGRKTDAERDREQLRRERGRDRESDRVRHRDRDQDGSRARDSSRDLPRARGRDDNRASTRERTRDRDRGSSRDGNTGTGIYESIGARTEEEMRDMPGFMRTDAVADAVKALDFARQLSDWADDAAGSSLPLPPCTPSPAPLPRMFASQLPAPPPLPPLGEPLLGEVAMPMSLSASGLILNQSSAALPLLTGEGGIAVEVDPAAALARARALGLWGAWDGLEVDSESGAGNEEDAGKRSHGVSPHDKEETGSKKIAEDDVVVCADAADGITTGAHMEIGAQTGTEEEEEEVISSGRGWGEEEEAEADGMGGGLLATYSSGDSAYTEDAGYAAGWVEESGASMAAVMGTGMSDVDEDRLAMLANMEKQYREEYARENGLFDIDDHPPATHHPGVSNAQTQIHGGSAVGTYVHAAVPDSAGELMTDHGMDASPRMRSHTTGTQLSEPTMSSSSTSSDSGNSSDSDASVDREEGGWGASPTGSWSPAE